MTSSPSTTWISDSRFGAPSTGKTPPTKTPECSSVSSAGNSRGLPSLVRAVKVTVSRWSLTSQSGSWTNTLILSPGLKRRMGM